MTPKSHGQFEKFEIFIERYESMTHLIGEPNDRSDIVTGGDSVDALDLAESVGTGHQQTGLGLHDAMQHGLLTQRGVERHHCQVVLGTAQKRHYPLVPRL